MTNTPTYLTLDTGNGFVLHIVHNMEPAVNARVNSAIDAKINLDAPRPVYKKHHSTFQTSIKTFGAPLNVSVSYDKSTPTSELHLRAQNNLAESHVSLDPKYEGTFDLQTKLSSAVVTRQDKKVLVTDPSGQNRQRHLEYDHTSSTRMFGWVGWGQRPRTTRKTQQGHVEIASSHSPVYLELDEIPSGDTGQS